jgi:hypothetical protein
MVDYTMRSLSGNEIESLAAHVLARAYRDAWFVLHGEEPFGPHVIVGLDLIIEFPGEIRTLQ